MAKIQIKSETRHELSFFPNSFDDYVPKDSKVRIVGRIVRSMDINPLMDTYAGTGAPPYSPMMLLSLVIFAYINGVYGFKNKAKLMEKASAALAQIKEQIRQNGGSDNKEGDDEPIISSKDMEASARLCERLVRELPDKALTGREKQKLNTQISHLFKASDKLREYENSLEILGERNSYSKTDPDATFMRLKEDAMNNGQTKPAYNLQIATENQYWTNFALYHNPTDTLTFKPFLDKYKKRHGKQSKCVTADSGYGSEENYEYMEMEDMVGYVKYNWFHKEQHKPFKEDVFNQANFYYNKDEDYYVCPMGQHMNPCGQRQTKSDSGYVSVITLYRAQRCEGCPLGSLCKKAKGNRTIYVNHKLNAYKKEAFLLLTSEEGMKHRSQRPIEPEAAFGQIKEDMHYKRFRHFGKDKVYMDIGLFGIGFNLKKHLGIKR